MGTNPQHKNTDTCWRSNLISVIIPAYNVADLLPTAISSVVSQRPASGHALEPFEIVIVDDGSTDDTAAVVRAASKRDPRVRLVSRPHGGPGLARNTGLAACEGDRVVFVDADDRLLPGALDELASAMPAEPGSIVIAGHTESGWHAASGRIVDQVLRPVAIREALGPGTAFRRYVYGRIPSVVWAAMFSRSLFNDIRFRECSPHADAEIMPRLIRSAGHVILIPGVVYEYRRRPGSVVDSVSESRLNSIRVQRGLLKLASTRPNQPMLRSAGRRAVIGSAFGLAAFITQKRHLGTVVDIERWARCIRRTAGVRDITRWMFVDPWLRPTYRLYAASVLLGPRTAWIVDRVARRMRHVRDSR